MQVRILTTMTMLTAAHALAGCGDRKETGARADARAAGFVPPSVTSRLDYGSAMDRRFRRLDRDGSDAITSNELPARGAQIRELDSNKDGRISSIEYSEGTLARFDRMDLNHDGTVTSEERETARGR